MLQSIQHRQQHPHSRQQSWSGGLSSSHLATTQTQQQLTQFGSRSRIITLYLPNHDAGHRCNQQPLGNCWSSFLLPFLQMLACTFTKFEIRFDNPTPVVPFGDHLSRDFLTEVGQQQPFTSQSVVWQEQSHDNQAQLQRRSLFVPSHTSLTAPYTPLPRSCNRDLGLGNHLLCDDLRRQLHRTARTPSQMVADFAQPHLPAFPNNMGQGFGTYHISPLFFIPVTQVADRVAFSIADMDQWQAPLIRFQRVNRRRQFIQMRMVSRRFSAARRVNSVCCPQAQAQRCEWQPRAITGQECCLQLIALILAEWNTI